jgi:hypothetical protein
MIFGVRVEGEPIGEPKLRTVNPKQRPDENQWNEEFKVSMLHNVKQHVFFN